MRIIHPRPNPIIAAMYTLRDLDVDVMCIHGPAGCGFMASRMIEEAGIRVVTSGLRDQDLIFGGSEPLIETLRLAREKFDPKTVAVVGTCSSMIIGEDMEASIKLADIGCNVFPVDCHGCMNNNTDGAVKAVEAAGIGIETFSPVAGDSLPDADIYYLGGGYPELCCEAISENRDFLEGLRSMSDEGRTIIGECGGLMTLCSSISDSDGNLHRMSGIIDGDAVMSGRHGPSYNIARPTKDNVLFGETVKGHAFHHSEIRLRREYPMGFEMERGSGITDTADGIVIGRTIGSYTHQHALSCRDWLGGLE